jgi:hypothetical protein
MFSSEYLTSMEKMICKNSLKYNGLNTKASIFTPNSFIQKPTKCDKEKTVFDYSIVSNRISDKLKKRIHDPCNNDENTIKNWKLFLHGDKTSAMTDYNLDIFNNKHHQLHFI